MPKNSKFTLGAADILAEEQAYKISIVYSKPILKMTIDKRELAQRVSRRVNKDIELVEEIIDAAVAEIYESLKYRESVQIRNFGTFYIRPGQSCVFKFNPAQRLRKLFGWSSTYKGES